MFTVGEFSQLAQVSKRLLRYYDQIDLLKPVHTDPLTGYRYYSPEQMPDLNRILALKDLGLSLGQIRQVLSDHVTLDEMQGMLLLKKAEIEQQLQNELQRIRSIESRLQAIRSAQQPDSMNVVMKTVPAQPVLSVRAIVETFDVGMKILGNIRRALPEKNGYGLCFCMCHDNEIIDHNMDLEMGRLIDADSHMPVNMDGAFQLRFRELPAAPIMATTVVKGALGTIHTGYVEIGAWIAANGYRPVGIPRELALKPPSADDFSDFITEIQFPVEPAETRRQP